MERYNPPSTSAQADCFGCNRQLHKIQELMDQTYLLNVSHQIEMNKMSHRVRVLERHLSCERLRNRRNEALMNNDVLDEGKKDDTVKELLEINEKLNDDLLKTSEEAETFPFEEWKKAIDGKWSDQYEELKEFALSKQDEVEQLNRQIRKQKEEIAKFKKQVEQMKKVHRTNDDQLETLMRSSAFSS